MRGSDGLQSPEERRNARKIKIPRPMFDGPRHFEGGPWTAFVSLVALVLSAISLYQTTLKQPKPTLYIPGTFRFGHDSRHDEFFAIPVTIANHGPRDAVITRIALSVMKDGAQGPQSVFAASFFGDAPKPSENLFTPISVAGHSSFAGTIVFSRASAQDGAAVPGKGAYKLCLLIQSETGDDIGFLTSLMAFQPSVVTFQAQIPYFDLSQLAAGQDITSTVQTIARVKGGESLSEIPACR